MLVCLPGDDRPPGLANKSEGWEGWDDPAGSKLGKRREGESGDRDTRVPLLSLLSVPSYCFSLWLHP